MLWCASQANHTWLHVKKIWPGDTTPYTNPVRVAYTEHVFWGFSHGKDNMELTSIGGLSLLLSPSPPRPSPVTPSAPSSSLSLREREREARGGMGGGVMTSNRSYAGRWERGYVTNQQSFALLITGVSNTVNIHNETQRTLWEWPHAWQTELDTEYPQCRTQWPRSRMNWKHFPACW